MINKIINLLIFIKKNFNKDLNIAYLTGLLAAIILISLSK